MKQLFRAYKAMKVIVYILIIHLSYLSVLPAIQFIDSLNNFQRQAGNTCDMKFNDAKSDEQKESCCQNCNYIQNQTQKEYSNKNSKQNTNEKSENKIKYCNPLENCNDPSCVMMTTQKLFMDTQVDKISISHFLSPGQTLNPMYSFWHPPKIYSSHSKYILILTTTHLRAGLN